MQRGTTTRRASATIALALSLPAAAWAQGTSAAGWRLPADLPVWLGGMVMALGLVLGLLSHLHRRERELPWLAMLMLGWAAQAALAGSAAPLLPSLVGALLALQLLALVRYLLGVVGWHRAWLDMALWLQFLAVPLSHQFIAAAGLPSLERGWMTLLAAQALAALAWQLHLRGQEIKRKAHDTQARRDRMWMALLFVGALVAVACELAAWLGHWAPGQPIAALLRPLLLLGLGLHALALCVRNQGDAEAQLKRMEHDHQEQLSAMERRYAETADQRLEQVTERERKRIAADLHDDLGAKLLTIVHTSESDRISTLAREALEEMRLSVRGLTGKPVQLIDALGDWRAEAVSRLSQANILAEWKSPAEDVEHTLPARTYVQTTRILRESVNNIIKHSGATHCTISCNVLDSDFQLVIQDNGQGISTELDGRLDKGHGMAGMKSRAKQMHGQCLVESGPGWGTVIRLTIPL
jgi:signal transduction histidine kinase